HWPREARAQGTDELASLRNQVSALYGQRKYTEAAQIAERYVALARQKHGENHIEYATAIVWLAYVYRGQDRSDEAEPLYKRSLQWVGAKMCPGARPATRRPSRSTSARWRFTRRCWGRTTPMSPPPSTASPSTIASRADTRRPSRSTSDRWRSARRGRGRTT